MTDKPRMVRLKYAGPHDMDQGLRENDVGYLLRDQDDNAHLLWVDWVRAGVRRCVWSDQIEELEA